MYYSLCKDALHVPHIQQTTCKVWGHHMKSRILTGRSYGLMKTTMDWQCILLSTVSVELHRESNIARMFFKKEKQPEPETWGHHSPFPKAKSGDFAFILCVTCFPYKGIRDRKFHQQLHTHNEGSFRYTQSNSCYVSPGGGWEMSFLAEQTEAQH